MHPDIHWPKAFEGGYVTGHEAVRDYWTRQWSEINARVTPVAITERPDGKVEVDVDQLVKDLGGRILFEGKVKHVHVIKDGLLQQMAFETSFKEQISDFFEKGFVHLYLLNLILLYPYKKTINDRSIFLDYGA